MSSADEKCAKEGRVVFPEDVDKRAAMLNTVETMMLHIDQHISEINAAYELNRQKIESAAREIRRRAKDMKEERCVDRKRAAEIATKIVDELTAISQAEEIHNFAVRKCTALRKSTAKLCASLSLALNTFEAGEGPSNKQ